MACWSCATEPFYCVGGGYKQYERKYLISACLCTNHVRSFMHDGMYNRLNILKDRRRLLVVFQNEIHIGACLCS